MKVTMTPTGTTIDSLRHIGEMASIRYDSDTSLVACVRRALKFKAYATFNVAGISRVCSHQIVRMAQAGILQRSQRYVKETKVEFVFVDPPALADCPQNFRDEWRRVQREAEMLYLHALDNKMLKKEDARYILPQGCTTEMNLCLNFLGWRDFIKNRNDKHAQWEVRAVAEEINRQLGEIAPGLFGETK